MNFPFYIAQRYLVSKSSNNAINIITLFASLGVVFATAALFIVLSGFSGLKDFSIGFYQAADPDLKISIAKGKTFQFSDSLASILNERKEIVSFSKVLVERSYFNYEEKEQIAYIYGVDENFLEVTKMDTTLIGGSWLNLETPYGVVAGSGVAHKLSMGIDYLSPLKLFVPKPGKTYDLMNPKSLVHTLNTQNIGVFSLLEEWDNQYVYAQLPIVQELLEYPLTQISGVNIKLENEAQAKEVSNALKIRLSPTYRIQTRKELNAVFYKMLNTENLVLYFVFTLVLIVALFNIIGTLIMMILDKKTNLKTLSNLGLPLPKLQKIFVYQGFLLSVSGMIIGMLLGVLLVILQQKFQLFMINSQLAYPVKLTFQNVVIVVCTMTVLSYFAAKIAGSKISLKMLN